MGVAVENNEPLEFVLHHLGTSFKTTCNYLYSMEGRRGSIFIFNSGRRVFFLYKMFEENCKCSLNASFINL